MRIYSLACRKHTNNVGSWNTVMAKKVIRNKSKCDVCNNKKSRFRKLNHSKNCGQ